MSEDFTHAQEFLDKARYYLGQALLATRKEKDAAKKSGELEWRDILNDRCDKIRHLYDRCDLLLCLSPAEKMYVSKALRKEMEEQP